jgi:hypothetical protein
MVLMARVFLVSIWLAAAGMTGVLGFLGYELARSPRESAVPISIERPRSRQSRNPWARWSVTEHISAHRVLIAHVETEFLEEAVAITQQVVEPVKEQYAEALVYFHRPGRPDTLPPRRVQWTRARGYVETVYEPSRKNQER